MLYDLLNWFVLFIGCAFAALFVSIFSKSIEQSQLDISKYNSITRFLVMIIYYFVSMSQFLKTLIQTLSRSFYFRTNILSEHMTQGTKFPGLLLSQPMLSTIQHKKSPCNSINESNEAETITTKENTTQNTTNVSHNSSIISCIANRLEKSAIIHRINHINDETKKNSAFMYTNHSDKSIELSHMHEIQIPPLVLDYSPPPGFEHINRHLITEPLKHNVQSYMDDQVVPSKPNISSYDASISITLSPFVQESNIKVKKQWSPFSSKFQLDIQQPHSILRSSSPVSSCASGDEDHPAPKRVNAYKPSVYQPLGT